MALEERVDTMEDVLRVLTRMLEKQDEKIARAEEGLAEGRERLNIMEGLYRRLARKNGWPRDPREA